MTQFFKLHQFLNKKCPAGQTLLLALSGGPDSLALFYGLLELRQKNHCLFHVAHVDHRWRKESAGEANLLEKLCADHDIPFHLKVLNPNDLKGNLEAVCREERYQFFSEICRKHQLYAVLTGHHQNDQAETILKRVFEGAHWSKWGGLKEENFLYGMKVLRPFLNTPKLELYQLLDAFPFAPFQDVTNQDDNYLRPRLRKAIFPWLNETFGKRVEPALLSISKEMAELTEYFEEKLHSIMKQGLSGPWGAMLDLQSCLPSNLLEIKYLVRLFCQQHAFAASRTIIDQASIALAGGAANQLFIGGQKKLRIDRRRLYMDKFIEAPLPECIDVAEGNYLCGKWEIHIQECSFPEASAQTSWKEGIQGYLTAYVPQQNYTLGWIDKATPRFDLKKLKKKWSEKKIPAFLYDRFPVLWHQDKIEYEFLTGGNFFQCSKREKCWKIELKHIDRIILLPLNKQNEVK